MNTTPGFPDCLVEGLVILAQHNIYPDVQELLVAGDAMRGVKPNSFRAALLAAEERGAARERERCVGIVESGSNAALRLLEVNDPDEAEVRIVSFVLSKACTQLANKIRGNSA